MKMRRRHKLGEPEAKDWADTTLEERVAAVWELTQTAHAIKGEDPGERPGRCDLVPVVRRSQP